MDYIGYVLTRKEMLVDEFADYLKRERRCSGRTVTAYRSDLQQFCDFYGIEGREEEFARVTVEDVRAWLAEGIKSQPSVYIRANGVILPVSQKS